MTEQLGKIEKPAADEFRDGRKLFFVPLIIALSDEKPEFPKLVKKYWDQVEEQVAKLETTLGKISRVYHEMIPLGGKDGLRAIKDWNSGTYRVVQGRIKKKAQLEPLEDSNILAEFMDWNKCLLTGLQSATVFNKIYEFFTEAQKRRNGHIAKIIDETLKHNEIGVLFMREGHQVQFPSDIQVFYISPPSLDEIKRWLRDREAELRAQVNSQEKQPEASGKG